MAFDLLIRGGTHRRRLGRRALSRRRRNQGRPDRRDRAHPIGGRAHHRRRRPDRRAGLHRRPHPHGRPGGVGPDRKLLLLARRDHRDHGQLWLRAGAVPARGARVVRSLPDRGRGHPDRGDDGRDRLDLGDLPGVPGERRPPAEGDQLRRLHRPLGPAHVRHGQARVDRARDRGRPDADGRGGAGGDPRRRDGLLELARDDPRHARQHAGGESHRRLDGARSSGRRDGRAERRRVPGRSGHLGRRGAARFLARLKQLAVEYRTAGDVRHASRAARATSRIRGPISSSTSTNARPRARGCGGRRTTRSINAIFSLKSYLPFDVLPAWRQLRRLPLGGAEAAPRRPGDAPPAGRRRGAA